MCCLCCTYIPIHIFIPNNCHIFCCDLSLYLKSTEPEHGLCWGWTDTRESAKGVLSLRILSLSDIITTNVYHHGDTFLPMIYDVQMIYHKIRPSVSLITLSFAIMKYLGSDLLYVVNDYRDSYVKLMIF